MANVSISPMKRPASAFRTGRPPRAIIAAAIAATAAAGMLMARSYGSPTTEADPVDTYARYGELVWPCGPNVPEWSARPADPHHALRASWAPDGSWPGDDDIRATLTGLRPAGPPQWTTERLAGLRMWVGALRGAHYWVLDTYGPLLAQRPLDPAEENERSKTLADADQRFHRALELTASEISTGKPADWGDTERPTTSLCEGIYRGR